MKSSHPELGKRKGPWGRRPRRDEGRENYRLTLSTALDVKMYNRAVVGGSS